MAVGWKRVAGGGQGMPGAVGGETKGAPREKLVGGPQCGRMDRWSNMPFF